MARKWHTPKQNHQQAAAGGDRDRQRGHDRAGLWLNDGSCVRLRPAYPGHVWSYDFVQDRTDNGRPFRTLTVIDEFTRESVCRSTWTDA